MPDLTAAHRAYAAQMPEAELEENVRLLCKALGASRWHTHRSQHSPAGWPDDVIGGPGGILYRELKREGKHPTTDQQACLDLLASHDHDVGVWRPTDWFSGRIRAEIEAVVRRR